MPCLESESRARRTPRVEPPANCSGPPPAGQCSRCLSRPNIKSQNQACSLPDKSTGFAFKEEVCEHETGRGKGETVESVTENCAAGEIAIFPDRKSTRLNSSHIPLSRMPASVL